MNTATETTTNPETDTTGTEFEDLKLEPGRVVLAKVTPEEAEALKQIGRRRQAIRGFVQEAMAGLVQSGTLQMQESDLAAEKWWDAAKLKYGLSNSTHCLAFDESTGEIVEPEGHEAHTHAHAHKR